VTDLLGLLSTITILYDKLVK